MNRLQCIDPVAGPPEDLPLYGVAASRQIESLLASSCEPGALMQRAGLALAKLALALAPQADRFWIACGPGNNGGDGFEAAAHLQRAGKQVHVNAFGDAARRPADATAAVARAQQAGVRIDSGLADDAGRHCGLAIDALLGLGATRALQAELAAAVERLNALDRPRLAVDLPSGLDAERGAVPGGLAVRATDTLALLTLKPGLFTAQGRDHAGRVWFDDLGLGAAGAPALPAERARLGGAAAGRALLVPRRHAQHKGSFGDVVVVGGAAGMAGAALLAARAAATAGAGRVIVCALDAATPIVDPGWPELMLRPDAWRDAAAVARATVVCGCGGGDAVCEALPLLLARAPRLVLDADALNAVAADAALQSQLRARAGRGQATVLTPHPLEAARLLALPDAAALQADRLGHAEAIAAAFECVVLLKGSGSVIAAPQQTSLVNASGNARLASAGTGDVLAGWLGGAWSADRAGDPLPLQRLAAATCWLHGRAAGGPAPGALTASRLIDALAR